MPVITYREALRLGMSEEMRRDPNVIILGEEVGQFKGSYKVTQGMLEEFGPKRIIDTPISEAGFIGLAIGAAQMGMRPICELMFWSFSYVAFDQIVNNAANIRYMSGGLINIPLVIRGPANGGTGVGATHSHTPENLLANAPGLKVVCPSCASDAKGLIKTAIRDNDPVYIMENTLLYGEKEEVSSDDYTIPLGKAAIRREGKDLTIIAHGMSVKQSLLTADILAKDHGIETEVVDLRSIRPLDVDTIVKSAIKTGRVVIVEENKPFCGVGAQISHMINDLAFGWLDAPVKRVSAIDSPAIYSGPLESIQLPKPDRILKTCLQVCPSKKK